MPMPQQFAQGFSTGVPQGYPSMQVLPPSQGTQYGLDMIPGAQHMQPQQVQPGVPGAQIMQPYYPQQGFAPQGYAQVPLQPQGPPQGGYRTSWDQQGFAQPQQQGYQGPQMNMPFQPAQGGYGQPQPYLQQQPQGAPQQMRAAMDDNMILDGPGVPPELRGRSWGDAKRLYNALASDFTRRNPTPQSPAQGTLQQQGYGQAPQGYGQGPQAPQQWGQAPAQGSFMNQQQQQFLQAVDQVVSQRLQPVLQQTAQSSIERAREEARRTIPDFNYLEADIMAALAGTPAEVLTRQDAWTLAAKVARGERVGAGTYAPQRMQPMVPGGRPAGQMGPGYAQPAQPTYSFFTESPTAPATAGFMNGGMGPRQLTQEDNFMMQKFGMNADQWMAWKYGVQPQGQQVMGGF